MSELPVIDAARLSKKLMSEISELTYQKYQLEVLAETLRDERDEARRDADEVRVRLREAQEAITLATPVPTTEVPVSDEVYDITTVDRDVA